MPAVVLVELSAIEQVRLSSGPDVGQVSAAALEELLTRERDDVEVVVISSSISEPIVLAQLTHRLAPDAGVILLTSTRSVAEVRRQVAYAPSVPLDLVLLASDEPLVDHVAELRDAITARRRHRSLLTAVSQQLQDQRSVAGAPAVLLGSLLEQAPLGVLICDPEGGLLGWNRRSEALLDVASVSVGDPVDALLSGAGAVVRGAMQPQLEPSRGSQRPWADRPTVIAHVSVPGLDVEVELTAVISQLSDGRAVALLLVADVTAQRDMERLQAQMSGQLELLARVSDSLSATLDMAGALQLLTDAVVPVMAEWAGAWVLDDLGRVSAVAIQHRDPDLRSVVEEARGLLLASSATAVHPPSQPVLLQPPTVDDLTRFVGGLPRQMLKRLGAATLMVVPLSGRSAHFGALVLANGESSPPLSGRDLAFAAEVGRRAAGSLENARLYALQRHLATELQHSLLTEPPESDLGDIAVRYLAAAEVAQVGGDWYDAFIQPDGATVLVIGDASGHDSRAAAAMGQIRGVLRGIGFTTNASPVDILSRLDQAIRGLFIGTLVTAVVARVEHDKTKHGAERALLRWSSAGHPPPVALYPDGHVEILHVDAGSDGPADLLLGIDASAPRRESMARLPWGSTVLLYTDGLIERRGQALDEGLAQLTAVLGSCGGSSLDELCDFVLAEVLPEELEDDVALIALRLQLG